jgi:hypothetical protein
MNGNIVENIQYFIKNCFSSLASHKMKLVTKYYWEKSKVLGITLPTSLKGFERRKARWILFSDITSA